MKTNKKSADKQAVRVTKPLRHPDGKPASRSTMAYHGLWNVLIERLEKKSGDVSIGKLVPMINAVLVSAYGFTADEAKIAAERVIGHQLPIDSGFGRKTVRVTLTGCERAENGKPIVSTKTPNVRVAWISGQSAPACRLTLADCITQRDYAAIIATDAPAK